MNNEWRAAKQVIEKIEQAGFEAVFVGGAVRDHLLNKKAHDVDIATSALPEEVKRIFHKTVDIGIEHGTILVLDEGEPLEVTTYRTEGDYIDFRRPEAVQFVRNLEEDLKRRDFTMNALAMKHTGEIVDLYGGRLDLERKVIRAVGNPNERFSEDALRMLRAARFSAQLGFTIEEKTLEAMQQLAHLIEHIAIERIAQELEKMWTSSRPMNGVKVLVESGLAKYLPGDLEGTAHYWQVFKAMETTDVWAYLLLITGDESLAKRYKLSNKEKNYYIHIREALKLLQHNVSTIALFEVATEHLQTAARFAQWLGLEVHDVGSLIARKEAFVISDRSQLVVTGNELLAWTGKRGGPWVKEALNDLLQAVLEQKVANDQQQLKDWLNTHDND